MKPSLATHRRSLLGALLLSSFSVLGGCASSSAARPTPGLASGDTAHGAGNFYTSDKVTVQKVVFKNQYKMKTVGNMFVPKGLNRDAKVPALVVGHPKELVVVPGAGHVDLYDRVNRIPFDTLTTFFRTNLQSGVATPKH